MKKTVDYILYLITRYYIVWLAFMPVGLLLIIILACLWAITEELVNFVNDSPSKLDFSYKRFLKAKQFIDKQTNKE